MRVESRWRRGRRKRKGGIKKDRRGGRRGWIYRKIENSRERLLRRDEGKGIKRKGENIQEK